MNPSLPVLLAILAPFAGPVPVEAQVEPSEEPEVRHLTSEEATAEALREILKPTQDPPRDLLRARGSRSLGAAPVDCEAYRSGRSRGVGVRPVADVASIEILFDFASAEIMPPARKSLDALGEALVSPELRSCCFEIQGHTDGVGSDGYNQSLSERRARAVVEYLAARFAIDAGRLLVVGYGEGRPLASNSTHEGRRKNRRVQIVNLGYGGTEP